MTNWGRLMWSTDRGVTWNESNDIGPEGQWLWRSLHASETVDTVTVGGSGYAAPPFIEAKTARTDPSTETGHPCVLHHRAPDGSGVLFAGTEPLRTAEIRAHLGWTSRPTKLGDHLLERRTLYTNAVRFGTYGRGIWDYELDPDNTNCYPIEDADGGGHACDVDCDDTDPTATLER